ncbi:lysophospholipid acyltransferase family protein [Yaniella halotolerans]|uniref:lysophospholipid acyltransferase family protein n=1 Tax=Yaniella halotolerans TaxID=225453 RepID=UPI0003B65211|nr:lysophospholipid acyltransferase family protein [Yaniella halotolerans]
MNVKQLLKRGLSGLITTASGARVRAEGTDGEAPDFPPQAIYFANHSSHLDFVTLWAIMPAELQPKVRPIAAADYWGSGLKQSVAEGIFNAHLVHRYKDRAHTPADARPTRQTDSGSSPKTSQLTGMTDILDAGDSLIIFPEGTRGPGDQVATFQAGLYRLAQHAPEVPVVPVTLKNLSRILPKGETIPVPRLSQVIVHQPLFVDDDESQEHFLSRARGVLADELATDAQGETA